MSQNTPDRVSPIVFIVGGAVILAAVGFGIDVLLTSGGSILDGGPLSDVTTYNFTLLGAVSGGVLGAFLGFGLV